MTDDRADYIIDLIRARCGDVLTDADLDSIAQPAAPPVEPDLPAEIGVEILNVLDSMMDRLDELAEAVGANGSDDVDPARRGVRQADQ
jgi:hypothetical protein